MAFKIATSSTILGLIGVVGIANWYWRYIYPELYIDQSYVTFLVLILVCIFLYLGISLGTYIRNKKKWYGTFMVSISGFFLVVISFATISTYGAALLPSAIIGSFVLTIHIMGRFHEPLLYLQRGCGTPCSHVLSIIEYRLH